ncbi:TolC family protein [Pseudomonas sp. USHLN015]|uniref:TolC family protein n=1 Tax=Pseudomonas sp. USHLN015 TaxID=3081296 RepID=UPI001BCAE2B4|nr:cytochrome c [Pseudomonas sp. Pc102]
MSFIDQPLAGLRRSATVLVITLGLSLGEALASPPALTLAEALERARANNPALAAAGWSVDIARGEREQASLLPNPELSWEMEDTRSDTRTTTVQISQPIELGGKRGARTALAERGIDAAGVEVERARNELRAEVIQAFYGALQADMRVSLAEQSQALAKRGVVIAEGRVRAGKVSPIELTRAQVQLAEVGLELRRATQERASAQVQLQVALGGDASAALKPVGDAAELPRMPDASGLMGALPGSAELRLAQRLIDQQDAAFSLEKRRRIPDLNISLGSQYSAEDRERVNVVGLSMPIPLFDRNQGNVLAAARRADQARDQRNAAELRLRGAVQQALGQWQAASAEVEAFQSALLPAASRAVDSTARGFEMGKFAFLDVLDAQRTLIQARSGYVQALASATAAWVSLERIYGDVSRIDRPGT